MAYPRGPAAVGAMTVARARMMVVGRIVAVVVTWEGKWVDLESKIGS